MQLTDGDDEDDEDAETSELYLVPQDPESRESQYTCPSVRRLPVSESIDLCLFLRGPVYAVPSMFEALSRAALLNPDPPEPGTPCSLMPIHYTGGMHAVCGEKWADGCRLCVWGGR